mmetsp:Transcript_113408/g.315750  ORF Transcript_113408/g.315750 Transcript_113408/m.315750 type:complete len:447 (+) Transcript_113408:58-1398(+)
MELRMEVLHAQDLRNAEYRLGDLSCSLLGFGDMRPFVEVAFQSQRRSSCPVHARDGTAIFSWSARFDVGAEEERRCTFRVYDKKGAQTAIRGDPLIGEAVLPLVDRLAREGLVATFTLRNGRTSTGRLTVHYELSRRPSGRAAGLCPGSALLGTAFGDDLICGGRGGAADEAAAQEALAPGQKSRRGSGGRGGHGTPELPSRASSSTSLDQSLARSESSGSFHSAVEDLEDPEETARKAGTEGATEDMTSEPWARCGHSGSAAPATTAAPAAAVHVTAATAVPAAVAPAASAREQRLPARGRAAAGAPQRQPLPGGPQQHHRRCEGVAETYMKARLQNNLDLLRGLFARDAVLAVPTSLGGAVEHRGWRGIEAYLLNNPVKPGCFSGWAHAHTQDDGRLHQDGRETTVVRWTGQVYKLGCWHHLAADIAVDPRQLLIRRVDVLRAK